MSATETLYSMAHLPPETAITLQGITAAYYQLSRLCHPDRDNTPGATERFQKLNELYTTALSQLESPQPSTIRKVQVPAATVLHGGTVAARYARASTPHGQKTTYEHHTVIVSVAKNTRLPAWVHVDSAGDELPGYARRGDAMVELIDADALVVAGPHTSSDVIARRIPGTYDLVAWATISSEQELVTGSTVQVTSAFHQSMAVSIGDWPTLQPQPIEFPGRGLPDSAGDVGTLRVFVTGDAKLRPCVATELANHYRAQRIPT